MSSLLPCQGNEILKTVLKIGDISSPTSIMRQVKMNTGSRQCRSGMHGHEFYIYDCEFK